MALLAFFRNAVLLKIGLIPLNSTNHVLLLRIFTALSGITNRLNQGVGRYREFVQRLIHIENSFMNTIQSSRVALIKKYHLGSFESSFQDSIEGLFRKNNEKGLNGK